MSGLAPLLAFASAALGSTGLCLLLPARTAVADRSPRWVRLLIALGARAGDRRTAPADLEQRIVAAGTPGGLGARELMAVKLTAAAVSLGFGAVAAGLAPGRLGVVTVLLAPATGFLAPDLWLARRARKRARTVRRELPGLLDLLRVTVEAGASLPAALAEVGGRTSGPVAAQWRGVGREVALGVPLAEALEGMAARLPQPEIAALCAALDRARRHGAPLGRTLSGQARDTRVALRRHVQEEAAKAGPKIQLVVALLLVPAVLLLVAAALASALLDGSQSLPVG